MLVVVLLSCLGLMLGMNQRSGFDISIPQVTYEPPPMATTEAQPEQEGELPMKDLENAGDSTKVLFIVLAILALLLLAFGTRKALQMLGSGKIHENEDLFGSELETSPDLTQILIPKVARAIDAGLEKLATNVSPRNGVIEAWHTLELAVEQSGVERSAAHTPTEFTLSVLDQLELDNSDITSLLSLFHQARFTEHEVSAADVARASDILRSLRTQLVAIDNARTGATQ